MNATLFLIDLLSYSLQTCLILGIGLLLPAAVSLDSPRDCLRYWYSVLILALTAPFSIPALIPALKARASVGPTSGPDPWIDVLAQGPVQTFALPWAALIVGTLVLGTMARMAWLLLGVRKLSRLKRDSKPLELALPQSFARLPLNRIDAHRIKKTQVFLSMHAKSPLTFGSWRPVVVLPANFWDLEHAEREGVLCHELLHVVRRDWLFTLAEEAVRVLLWFHPAVCVVLNRIALTREQVVDRSVVAMTHRRHAYLQALVKVARSCSQETRRPALLMFRRRDLELRILTLLKERPMSRTRLMTSIATMVTILATTTAIAATAFPLASSVQQKDEEASPIYVTEGVVEPVRLVGPPPEYTDIAREARLQGTVIVRAVINTKGKIVETKVLKGLPLGLTEAAEQAMKGWSFEPATDDGKPVSVYYNLTINFRLPEPEEAAYEG